MSDRWFFRDATGASWGQDWENVVEFCRSADLFVHISGSCNMREEYFSAARVVFIDSDPVYTQATIPEYAARRLFDEDLLNRMQILLKHNVFFTFAENISHRIIGSRANSSTGFRRVSPFDGPVPEAGVSSTAFLAAPRPYDGDVVGAARERTDRRQRQIYRQEWRISEVY